MPSHPIQSPVPDQESQPKPKPKPKRDTRVNADMSLAAHSRHSESGTQPSTPKEPVANRTVQIERMARWLLRRRIRFSHGTGGWFFSLQLPQSFETLVAACQRLSQGWRRPAQRCILLKVGDVGRASFVCRGVDAAPLRGDPAVASTLVFSLDKVAHGDGCWLGEAASKQQPMSKPELGLETSRSGPGNRWGKDGQQCYTVEALWHGGRRCSALVFERGESQRSCLSNSGNSQRLGFSLHFSIWRAAARRELEREQMPRGVALDPAKKNLEREIKRGGKNSNHGLGFSQWPLGRGGGGSKTGALLGAVFQHQSLTSWRAMRRRDSSRRVFR